MDTKTTGEDRKYKLTADELSHWNDTDTLSVLTYSREKKTMCYVKLLMTLAVGKIPFSASHINQNALVREGKVEKTGIMRCIRFIMQVAIIGISLPEHVILV